MCWQGEKHVRRDQVVDAFRSDCVDIVRDFISVVLEIGTVTRDCVNPQRTAVSQCEKLVLRTGFVVDLNASKPWNGVAWKMCRPNGGDELMDFLDKEDPELVMGSSSRGVSDFLKGWKRALEKRTDFHVCALACARQHQRGNVFLHEAQLDQRRGKTGTFHGSRHFLRFSRSRVQLVGGRFAEEM